MKILEKLYEMSQERYGNTAFGETAHEIRSDFEQMKGKWTMQIVCTVVFSVLMSGILTQIFFSLFKPDTTIIISKIPQVAFGKGFLFTIIMFVAANYTCYIFRRSLSKDYTHVADGNYELSEKGTYGTAREMTQQEREKYLHKAPIEKNPWIILGADRIDESQLYTHKHLYDASIGVKTIPDVNPHVAVVGTSMSGKTYSVIMPTIMQAIRRGESVITTSPKGELYENLASLAEENGYTVKVLNLNMEQIQNSDSIDYLKYAIKNPKDINNTIADVISISRTIIDNTRVEGEKVEKFFEDCALSLLQAMILWIMLSPDIPPEEKTLGHLYLKLSDLGVNGLLMVIGHLPPNHPAKRAFRTFVDASDSVRQSTVNGLCLKLNILASEDLRRLTDVNTMSLTDPGEKKCMYFIGMNVDQKSTLQFLVALYFSIQFQALISLAKSKYGRQGEKLPVPVNFILDEFANCGIIPNMPEKLSVVRSYNISIMYAIQDVNQLRNMYPQNDTWKTVLSQCSTTIVLKTNDPVTEKYFSEKSGISTVVSKSDHYQEGRADLLKAHPETTRSETLNKRYALNPDEINRLAQNELLVFITGKNYIKLHKFGMDKHPMYKQIKKRYILDYYPQDAANSPGAESTYEDEAQTDGTAASTSSSVQDKATLYEVVKPQNKLANKYKKVRKSAGKEQESIHGEHKSGDDPEETPEETPEGTRKEPSKEKPKNQPEKTSESSSGSETDLKDIHGEYSAASKQGNGKGDGQDSSQEGTRKRKLDEGSDDMPDERLEEKQDSAYSPKVPYQDIHGEYPVQEKREQVQHSEAFTSDEDAPDKASVSLAKKKTHVRFTFSHATKSTIHGEHHPEQVRAAAKKKTDMANTDEELEKPQEGSQEIRPEAKDDSESDHKPESIAKESIAQNRSKAGVDSTMTGSLGAADEKELAAEAIATIAEDTVTGAVYDVGQEGMVPDILPAADTDYQPSTSLPTANPPADRSNEADLAVSIHPAKDAADKATVGQDKKSLTEEEKSVPVKNTRYIKQKRKAQLPETTGPVFSTDDFVDETRKREEKNEAKGKAFDEIFDNATLH